MAQKSKTQRAKASAARAARKEARELESQKEAEAVVAEDSSKKTKPSLFKKSEESKPAQASSTAVKKQKSEVKVKKERFKFLKEVRSEMKRVTWPTKPEIIRWSVVVVAALVFFGVYVALLDNAIVTPLLVLISSLGA